VRDPGISNNFLTLDAILGGGDLLSFSDSSSFRRVWFGFLLRGYARPRATRGLRAPEVRFGRFDHGSSPLPMYRDEDEQHQLGLPTTVTFPRVRVRW
jgi:hypothetical protein